jgi:glycosyltransferase involved in cell wall biosynthesis
MSKILLVSLVHNRKHLLGAVVQSAINQTLSKDKWHHLLIDNNSTDGATEVCEMLANKRPHISLVKMSENIGQQRAYNYVLNEWIPANTQDTEIMAVLDSDDMLTPDALFEVEKMFDSHPEIGQTYSGFDIIDGNGKTKVKNHPKARLVQDQFSVAGQKQLRSIFISQNPIGHLRAFRIKCLRDIGGFNTNYEYATDYNAAGRMLEKYPVVKIDKVLYRWRQHGDQVEGAHSPRQTECWRLMQAEFKKRWEELGIV